MESVWWLAFSTDSFSDYFICAFFFFTYSSSSSFLAVQSYIVQSLHFLFSSSVLHFFPPLLILPTYPPSIAYLIPQSLCLLPLLQLLVMCINFLFFVRQSHETRQKRLEILLCVLCCLCFFTSFILSLSHAVFFSVLPVHFSVLHFFSLVFSLPFLILAFLHAVFHPLPELE